MDLSSCAHCKCPIPNRMCKRYLLTEIILFGSATCTLADIRKKCTGQSSDGYTYVCRRCGLILKHFAAYTDKFKGKLQTSCTSLSWIVEPSSGTTSSIHEKPPSTADAALTVNATNRTSCAHCKKKFIKNNRNFARILLTATVPFHDSIFSLADIRAKCFGLSSDGYAFLCDSCRRYLVTWVKYTHNLMKTLKPISLTSTVWEALFISCQQGKSSNEDTEENESTSTTWTSTISSPSLDLNKPMNNMSSLQAATSHFTQENIPTCQDTDVDNDAEDVLPPPSPPRPDEDTLPPNWRTSTDATGEVYYYNTFSRETQWHHPSFNDLIKKSATEMASQPDDALYAQSQSGTECQRSEGSQHIKLEKDSNSKIITTGIECKNFQGMVKWNCDIDTLIQIQSNKSFQKHTSAAEQVTSAAEQVTSATEQVMQVDHFGEGTSKLQNDSSSHKQDKDKHVCLHCNEEFFEKKLLFGHEVVHRTFECERCLKNFATASILLKHTKKHEHRMVKCPFKQCGVKCKNMATFIKHNKVHGRSLKCTICRLGFVSKEKLLLHSHAHAEPYHCVRCNVAFRYAKDFHKHKLLPQHRGEKKYKCSFCVKTFKDNSKVKDHENTHTGSRPHKCPYCPKTFMFRGSRNAHKLTHVKVFKCTLCQKTLSTAQGLKTHRTMVHLGGKHKCSLCLKAFFTKPELIDHKRIHTGEKPFKCSDCDKAFHSQKSLRSHSRIHVVEKTFKCSLCDRAFRSRTQLNMHAVVHSNARPYKCSQCDKSFKGTRARRLHERIHSGEKPYKCSQCDRSFKQSCTRRQHERIHSGEKQFKCSHCEMAFCTKSAMISHENKEHKGIEYKCSHCSRVCYTKLALTKHELSHTGEKSFKCLLCEKGFVSAQRLKSHKRIHTMDKPFKCSHCEKAFPNLNHLKTHERIHTGEKPFKCQHCDKAFTHNRDLKTHELYYHTNNPKPYKCHLCPKSFILKRVLVIHLRIHTGEKPYKCTSCGKAFTQAYHLTLHKRTHTGEKPFRCPFCDKSFTCSNNLRSHKRSHTGEKPFKCPLCDKSFASSAYCRNHQRSHTEEKPFQCSFCGQTFKTESGCKRHEQVHASIHTGDKPFTCSVCGKKFKSKVDWEGHERAHGKEKKSNDVDPGTQDELEPNKQYTCSHCEKRFARKSAMKSHERICVAKAETDAETDDEAGVVTNVISD